MNNKNKDIKRLAVFPVNVYQANIKPSAKKTSKLLKKIKDIQGKNKKVTRKSNYNGYHSPQLKFDDVVNSPFEFILEEAIYLINGCIIKNNNWSISRKNLQTLWFIINKKNDYNVVHTHPSSWYSGVYYVKVPKNSGNIFFQDPILERVHEHLTDINAHLETEEGMLLLFPSWVHHGVEESLTNKERVIVSFNISRPDWPIKDE